MLELDKKTFDDEVLKADGKVFVDFYGDGCVPCAALKPHVEEYAEQYGAEVLRAQHHQGPSPGYRTEDTRPSRHAHLRERRDHR